MCQFWCSSIADIYAQLHERGGVNLHGYMGIVLYMKLIWCNGFTEIYAQLGGVSICNTYMCIVLYICRSAIRCAKFGVVLFKSSLLESNRGQSVIDPCYIITPPLPIDHKSMLHCYTSLPIDHRSMLHHYTP